MAKTKKRVKKSLMNDGKHMMPGMPMMKKKSKNWIADAIKKPGALRRTAGVKKGQKIPKSRLNALAKKPGITGRRARLAETLSGFNKGKKVGKGARAYLKRVGMKNC